MTQQEIESQIKAISGNAYVLEELYKLLESKEASGFVGAGVSAGLWPLWDEFLKMFVEYAFSLGKINQDEVEYLLKGSYSSPLETAQLLKNKIGDRDYYSFFQETLKDKTSPVTNKAYTLTHKSLLQLPINNYVTLNYDAGLTNARADLYHNATTTYFFWDQENARDILKHGFKRLILHAHGRYDRSDSIVLTLDEYRKAYDNSAFVRLLNTLFNYQRLIFVGFGMTDPYIKQLFNNISKDNKTTQFQHIALIGLNALEMKTAHLHRERVEMVFGARVLFYPTENHHKALQDWLQMMVDNFKNNPSSSSVEEIKPLDTSLSVRIRIEDKYIHKPSDDENYKGRKDELVLLNRWANDPETRIIAIMGIGGQGKTSLTGRWLKYERIDNLINIPVFYWSFYEDLDVGKFFKEIIKFCIPITNLTRNNQIEPISFIISLVHEFRLLIVLDGLEVLQEEAANPNHGKFNHPLLYHFLLCWVRLKHKSLIILTSRFHFPQLQKYCGIGFHQLDLFRLNKKDGTALLRKLNIFGDEDVIGNYIEKLYGHPLALRVLASNIKRSCFGDISRFNGEIILNDEKNDKLNEKLKRLLNFYEKQLKDGQKELICILSLFKRPIELKSFVNLLNKMKSIANTPLAKADKSVIEKQINLLVDDFLIEKSKDGITTHPVIRDYFRATLNASRSRNEVAIFLKEKPGSESPTKIEEVQDLVEAVQLLCEDEDFDTANKLTHERLSVGGYGYDIFISLPAIKEGLELSLAFVGDKTRCKKIEKVLGKRTLAFHFSGAYLYNYYLGNFQQAIFYLNKCLEICRQTKDKLNMPGPIQEISLIEISAGKIEKGIKTIEQAICMSDKIRYLDHLRTQFSYLAYYKYLLGNSQDSFKYFEISLLYEQRRISSEKHLTSIYGNQQAEFFIRIKVWDKFELVNNWNIQNCINFYQNNDLAIAYLLKAWSKVQHTALIEAEEILLLAENILRTSCMLQEICRLDWIWALLFEAKKDFIKGLNHINNSLPICVDRGFHLWQADHFVLRGRLYLMQFNKENPKDINLVEKAGDNGKEALRIADNTGYIWVKVDALKLLASYHQTRAQLPDFDKGKELEFTQRFLNEASSIEKGLYLTEEQMKESIKQASREFEKQTEGWKSAY